GSRSSRVSPYTTLFRSWPHGKPAPTAQRGQAAHRAGKSAKGHTSTVRVKVISAEGNTSVLEGALTNASPSSLTQRAIRLDKNARSEEHTSELQSRFDLV